MAGKIHWKRKTYVDTVQSAYTDKSVWHVPFTGTFDSVAMNKALTKRFPRQSSYGALRWRTGIEVLSDLGNNVCRIVETSQICD